MKERLYHYAPLILLLAGFILWFAGFFLGHRTLMLGDYYWLLLLAFQILISLTSGVLIKSMYWLANTDSLTGLHTRRYFYLKLAELTKTIKQPVSLILIDLDDFKTVNDRYGHLTGDKVLKQLAIILRKNTRKKDIVARWGGEEFAVIMTRTSWKETYLIAERIREVVESYDFCSDTAGIRVTISIGMTTISEKTDKDSFFKLADQALYKAKEKKNLVVAVCG